MTLKIFYNLRFRNSFLPICKMLRLLMYLSEDDVPFKIIFKEK